MRFHQRNVLVALCLVSSLAVGLLVYQRAQHTAFLKSDPRRYYGALKLQPPIKHSGFSYFLDGGTITTVLTDANDVELHLSFSPPGEFFGDTEVFIGTKDQMWADYHARNETHGPPDSDYEMQATLIPRGSESSRLIAGYVASAVRTMSQEYAQMDAKNDWERWHILEFSRCNKVFGDRLNHILTSDTPVGGRWGYGEPHAPMPDPPG